MSQSVSGDPLDLDAIEQSDPVLVSNVIPALVAAVPSLRQENEQLMRLIDRQLGDCIGCTTEPDEVCPRDGRSYSEWVQIASDVIGRQNDQLADLDAARAELADLRAKIAAVEALCNVVRTLQKPDPDTGDRAVSFFALLDALDPDDAALSGSQEPGGDQ